ncbi:carbonic anhydrase [Streptomyces lunaelactis]|uniref:carbonic anhydrase n=1 Tax=Streptomyces lunaelactis TaxID=1535768 RepID=UPI001585209D|nr:carbonic anhydrase [Streptomyces lunaelactis]NUK37657.1 carbonic anhydrase [Streptomyces lunaelactis]NUK43591.1 carbonic anhydrase [Streptomyces lunaelactis]NUK60693.1 carbonic anhydrase [Streptomyces lunaelactis]NUK95143.1 carbonic anhydrase [Streptomyces lunaelactis]NUL23700.1 carbonic anhydrase [Streptomyces lunaelactis]
MHMLMKNARAFRQRAAAQAEEFGRLADGQSPQAMFITCSDSRVIPSLITGARPGELFELRTAGSILPAHDPDRHSSEAATIEYAVEVLGVADIVVCGHSHCGAVGAMVRREDLSAVPAVRGWLESASPPPLFADTSSPDIAQAVQHHVLRQLRRLGDYPCVARRAADGRLRLHGWFYEIDTGAVLVHRSHDDAFLPL